MLFIESAQVGVVACELARLPLGLGAARRRGFGPAIDPLGRGLDFLLNMPRWIVRPSRLLSPSPRECPPASYPRRCHAAAGVSPSEPGGEQVPGWDLPLCGDGFRVGNEVARTAIVAGLKAARRKLAPPNRRRRMTAIVSAYGRLARDPETRRPETRRRARTVADRRGRVRPSRLARIPPAPARYAPSISRSCCAGRRGVATQGGTAPGRLGRGRSQGRAGAGISPLGQRCAGRLDRAGIAQTLPPPDPSGSTARTPPSEGHAEAGHLSHGLADDAQLISELDHPMEAGHSRVGRTGAHPLTSESIMGNWRADS